VLETATQPYTRPPGAEDSEALLTVLLSVLLTSPFMPDVVDRLPVEVAEKLAGWVERRILLEPEGNA
jgi:hypothetical protein